MRRTLAWPALAGLLVAVALSTGGCSRPSLFSGEEAPDPPVEHVNSGRTLSGVYARTQPPGGEQLLLTASGEWTRTETSAAGTRTTGGSYLVDKDGKLVLYVERVGDGRLTTAREEVFALSGDPGVGIELRDGAGGVETFERTGDEPAPAVPGAPGS